jgi:hypothetical protein
LESKGHGSRPWLIINARYAGRPMGKGTREGKLN